MITHGIRTLLLAQSSITTLVPTQIVNRVAMPSIVCDHAPQGMQPPFVVIRDTGTETYSSLGPYTETLKGASVEIDCMAYQEPSARTLAQTIRQFFDDYSGAAGASDTIKAVIWDDEKPAYSKPNEGRDTRYQIVTEPFFVQYSTP